MPISSGISNLVPAANKTKADATTTTVRSPRLNYRTLYTSTSTQIGVLRFIVQWTPTGGIICCVFQWSLQDFVESLDEISGQKFDSKRVYQYKIRNTGEVILTNEDECRTLIRRIKKTLGDTRVFLRPITTICFPSLLHNDILLTLSCIYRRTFVRFC